MKQGFRNLKVATAVAIMSIATGASAAEWEETDFYPFEEATFTYKISGMQNGSQVQVIRDHGREGATFVDSTMSMMGMNQPTKTASWMTKDWVYNYDYTTGQGTKMANPMQNAMQNTDDPKQAYVELMTGLGGKQVGTDTHNGTPCNVWEIGMAGSRMCISDDLVMQYMRMSMGGMQQTIELVDSEIGPVDPARFERPDVPFNEMQMPPGMFGN